jgi:hypothetical protein
VLALSDLSLLSFLLSNPTFTMRLSAVVASAIYSSAFLAGAVSAQEEAAESVESSTTALAKPTFTVSHFN